MVVSSSVASLGGGGEREGPDKDIDKVHDLMDSMFPVPLTVLNLS